MGTSGVGSQGISGRRRGAYILGWVVTLAAGGRAALWARGGVRGTGPSRAARSRAGPTRGARPLALGDAGENIDREESVVQPENAEETARGTGDKNMLRRTLAQISCPLLSTVLQRYPTRSTATVYTLPVEPLFCARQLGRSLETEGIAGTRVKQHPGEIHPDEHPERTTRRHPTRVCRDQDRRTGRLRRAGRKRLLIGECDGPRGGRSSTADGHTGLDGHRNDDR